MDGEAASAPGPMTDEPVECTTYGGYGAYGGYTTYTRCDGDDDGYYYGR